MSIPIRFVVTTYNIWNTNRWSEREEAMRAYLQASPPDILALQELRPETRDFIDQELPNHRRIHDDFEGWAREGNIYWLDSMFELMDYDAADIARLTQTNKFRRLFWARLRVRDTDKTVIISTAHFTYQGHPDERESGQSPRNEQVRQTIKILDSIAKPDEPVIFMGDLNDSVNAIRALQAGGFQSSWQCLKVLPVVTHPAFPMAHSFTSQILDWQLNRGTIRAMTSDVRDFYLETKSPSDHKPLTVTYGLDG